MFGGVMEKMKGFRQFDIIRIITTKNIKYLATPDGVDVSPHGEWSIIAIVGGKEALVCKDGATCKVPLSDVELIAEYNLENLLEKLNGEKREGNGKEEA